MTPEEIAAVVQGFVKSPNFEYPPRRSRYNVAWWHDGGFVEVPPAGAKINVRQLAGLMWQGDEGMFGGEVGGGKGQALDAKILTPFGFREMADLRLGSAVCSPDGSVSKIIAIYPLGKRQLYRIGFHDGTSTEVTEDHIWLAWKAGKCAKKRGVRRFGDQSNQLWETSELIARHKKIRFVIPITKPVCFNDVSRYERRPVDPYLLGVLLGDGSLASSGQCSFCGKDKQIAELVAVRSSVQLNKPYKQKKGNCFVWGLRLADKNILHLRKWGLLGTYSYTKFIPESYLLGSTDERWWLLRGLMDTDGWVDKDGDSYFCTTSRRLADDVTWLVRSLGGFITERTKIPTYTYRGEHKKGLRCFTLRIKFEDNSLAFALTRKKKLCGRIPQCLGKRIISIKPSRIAEAQCIRVNHPSGLYITNDFIVTHNTAWALMDALRYFDIPGYSALLLRRTWAELSMSSSALIPLSKEWLAPFMRRGEAEWNENNKTWKSKEGGTLQFAHAEHEDDIYRFQGTDFQRIYFDQLELFSENQYLFLFRSQRKRSKGLVSQVPVVMRATAQPGGAAFVKQRFIIEHDPTRMFIPSRLEDNPFIEREQYRKKLEKMPMVMRRQMMGDWDIQSSGGFFQRDWFDIIQSEPNYDFAVRAWDTASTIPQPGTDPDYTVGTKVCTSKRDGYDVILHRIKFRAAGHTVEQIIEQTMIADGPGVLTVLEQQPGSAGENEAQRLQKKWARFWIKFVQPKQGRGGDKGKVLRAAPCQTLAGSGNVKLLAGDWNNDWLDEITAFGQKGVKDDSCLVAGTMVTTERGQIPIESVLVGDMAWTGLGWRKVLRCGKTGENKATRKVLFSDGRILIGTGLHEVFTLTKGYVPIDSLSLGDIVVVPATGLYTAKISVLDVQEVGSADVYNLQIEEAHEFFANGILVHNCDSWGIAHAELHREDIVRILSEPVEMEESEGVFGVSGEKQDW